MEKYCWILTSEPQRAGAGVSWTRFIEIEEYMKNETGI